MKNYFIKLMSVAMLVATGVFMSSCSSDDSNKQDDPYKEKWKNKTAKYTVMLYGCGGGDVDEQLDYAIDYVKNSLNVNNNQVRFVVMYSTSKTDKKHRSAENPNQPVNLLYGRWGCTYRYELTPGITQENYHERCYYKPASEVELYRVETIKEFINWTKQTAPAENYILMPTNHGGGFELEGETPTRSIIYDDNHVDETGDEECVATKAFAQALQETQTHLKAIYWNGCLMAQLEVLTEMAPYCDYQFCSAHIARVSPRHVYGIIDAINAFPDDFEQAAKQHGVIMNGPNGNLKYYDFSYLEEFKDVPNPKNLQEAHDENCDFGCWRSAGLAGINTQVKRLADYMDANYETYETLFGGAIWATYIFDKDQPYADVLDLALNVDVALKTQDPNITNVESIKQDLDNALKAACVYHIDGLHSKRIVENVQVSNWPASNRYTLGISIYSKEHKIYKKHKSVYKDSSFDKATGWSRFLDKNTVDINPKVNPSNDSWVDPEWI